LYKYIFDIDLGAKTVKISNLETRSVPNYIGTKFDLLVNQNYVIITCSDCPQATLDLFDHGLNYVTSYNMRA